MLKRIILALGFMAVWGAGITCHSAQAIVAQKADEAPVIDGSGSDSVWQKAQAVITHDKIADIDITLKAVYTDKEIFFLVTFPDPDESRRHKDWMWNKNTEMYELGPQREDVFVLKWNMESHPVDLSIYAEEPYTSDIWFWKACRTDPTGFADDKIDILNASVTPKAMKLTSKSGRTMYLQRLGDEGGSCYKETLYADYRGADLLQFEYQTPTGSRADIKAKGVWANGQWTIEFARALNTGNADDIQLIPGKSCQFGVSRYEISGKAPEPEASQPLYGTGDVSEELNLSFSQE